MKGMNTVSILWNLGYLVLSRSIVYDGWMGAGPGLWGLAWKNSECS